MRLQERGARSLQVATKFSRYMPLVFYTYSSIHRPLCTTPYSQSLNITTVLISLEMGVLAWILEEIKPELALETSSSYEVMSESFRSIFSIQISILAVM
jgi:hypothetical protein